MQMHVAAGFAYDLPHPAQLSHSRHVPPSVARSDIPKIVPCGIQLSRALQHNLGVRQITIRFSCGRQRRKVRASYEWCNIE